MLEAAFVQCPPKPRLKEIDWYSVTASVRLFYITIDLFLSYFWCSSFEWIPPLPKGVCHLFEILDSDFDGQKRSESM